MDLKAKRFSEEEGLVHVRITKLVENTTLAGIIHAVEEAQSTRAPVQR